MLTLPIGPLAGLAQIQEPGSTGGEARGGRGLGTIGMTDRRLPELIGICVLEFVAWHWRLIANSLPWSLPRLRVLQVTQCARSFGEGAARSGDIFRQGVRLKCTSSTWIVLAILLGLLAVTRLLRYDDVSHYEVFSVESSPYPEPECPNARITYHSAFP